MPIETPPPPSHFVQICRQGKKFTFSSEMLASLNRRAQASQEEIFLLTGRCNALSLSPIISNRLELVSSKISTRSSGTTSACCSSYRNVLVYLRFKFRLSAFVAVSSFGVLHHAREGILDMICSFVTYVTTSDGMTRASAALRPSQSWLLTRLLGPEFHADGPVAIKGGRHPILEKINRETIVPALLSIASLPQVYPEYFFA